LTVVGEFIRGVSSSC